jgi:hypothetical protein
MTGEAVRGQTPRRAPGTSARPVDPDARGRRVLLPRVDRAATVLLEVADYDLAAAIAAVVLAAEAHGREVA